MEMPPLYKTNKPLRVIGLNILKFLNQMVYPMQRGEMYPLQKRGVWPHAVKPFMTGKMAKPPFESNQKSWIIIRPLPGVKYF